MNENCSKNCVSNNISVVAIGSMEHAWSYLRSKWSTVRDCRWDNIAEDLPLNQARKMGFIASSLLSIRDWNASMAAPILPAWISALHSCWFAVFHNSLKFQPKSCKTRRWAWKAYSIALYQRTKVNSSYVEWISNWWKEALALMAALKWSMASL